MLLSSTSYLLLLCVFLLVGGLMTVLNRGLTLPDRLVDDRDLVALFGWVGLMISGISTIVVPNHVGVRLGPRLLPRVHLLLTNIGILGFFVVALLWPSSPVSEIFLMVAVFSFLLFGATMVRTLWPFLRGSPSLPPPGGGPAQSDARSSRAPSGSLSP